MNQIHEKLGTRRYSTVVWKKFQVGRKPPKSMLKEALEAVPLKNT